MSVLIKLQALEVRIVCRQDKRFNVRGLCYHVFIFIDTIFDSEIVCFIVDVIQTIITEREVQ